MAAAVAGLAAAVAVTEEVAMAQVGVEAVEMEATATAAGTAEVATNVRRCTCQNPPQPETPTVRPC